ncbi:protein-disulfide reductase DsbD family protein [Hymenobacter siberiensis]|jgi:thiol:disulfide interchange protein|uniref:protein-disulfide reductase DsbD family protein n=1 Tax=Hymenobacter siberiensis TaxID=2848396 RepID=UPI001C1E5DF3|nr:cytochrome c biogenesis protein CcdA [Hymenobacter siberiensis]MBU6120773.1 thioredoxin family protein [Hymenobacter siberiensis]
MKNFRILTAALFWLALMGPAAAQILTPTHLSTALSKPTAKVGEEVELIINARIDDKWHLYASDFSDEVGPVVFTLKFKPSPAYALVGKLQAIKSHHEQDEIFKGEVAFWEKTGQMRQRIKILQPGALSIVADADYQSCTTVDGKCVPGSETLKFGPLTAIGAAAPAKATGAMPPAAMPTTAAVAAAPTAAAPAAVQAADPAGDTAAQAATAAVVPAPATSATPEATAAPAPAVASVALAADPVNKAGGLWAFALLAFTFGLAALVTPCVFPMVPMTVSLFTSGNDSRQRGIFKALVYGASIIGIYVLMGVLVSVLLGEDGPNLIATHWIPNLIFFIVFVVFGLSFLGLFEITLPHQIVNSVDAQADKGGWAGIFFMALTLVVVSFSCTAPIVGSILSMAARGERITPIVGMLGFSLAFALPFTLFAIFPSWLKSLPRSGGWLNTVKVVLGFIELMLALKFLSTADLAYHWHLLNRDVYIVLWIVLSALLGFYLLGKFRLSHDSPLDHLSVGRLLMAVLAFAFTVYLVPGLFGAPLPLLAGYLPPQSKHDFSLATAEGGAAPAMATSTAGAAARETPRFGEFLELPHNLDGYFDLEQAKRVARLQHKPIFIDFTGHACVNCRKMEATVWSDPQVLTQLRNDYVVVALYVDDKTELPQKEWYTSTHDNQIKTTLGKQNADLQITRYGINAQPYYVILDADDATSQPLVTPIAYEPDVAQFSAFLQAGSKQYRTQRVPVAAR